MRSGLEPCVSDVLLFWLFKYANWDLHSILLKRQDTTFAFHRHRQSTNSCLLKSLLMPDYQVYGDG